METTIDAPRSDRLRAAPERTLVVIPNLFQSFVVANPLIHPDYKLVRNTSEDWISIFCKFSEKKRLQINKCNFSLFCAISAPYAPTKRFRTLCDWGNWVFPYDDMFDNGELRDNPQASQQMMNRLMAPMLCTSYSTEGREAILRVHDLVFEQLSQPKRCSAPWCYPNAHSQYQEGIKRRFTIAMAKYCSGALTHVEDQFTERRPTLEEMVLTRRESAGVSPLYHLVEYAHDLHVPEEAFNDPLVQELEILGMDLIAISNDIISYIKEEREGVKHNMVAICRLNGMPAQQAFDEVGLLLQSRFDRWDVVEDSLERSCWTNNENVQKYVTGIKSVVQANISWR
ncbi:hypothetical protein S40293_09042 [Stachybotrys chartarum IBT 40293]|nr:hypothetical protein S40293_09042 [Stachybotrys chartarum IBT 40293]